MDPLKDFLTLLQRNHYMLLYVVVFLAALWRFPRYYQTPLRLLPVLLLYTLLTETLGLIIRTNEDFSIIFREVYTNNNWLIFNVYAILFNLYFYYVYYRYLEVKPARVFLKIGAVAYLGVALVNGVLDSFLTQSQVYAYLAGALVMGGASLAYLAQEAGAEGRPGFSRNLLVWISIGILVFCLGYTPIKYFRYLVANRVVLEYPSWVTGVHFALIYALYGAFLAGFLRMRWMRPPGPEA